MSRKRKHIKSSDATPPAKLQFTAETCTFANLEAEAAGDGPPTFEMLAYTGGKMILNGFNRPVIADLTGMDLGPNSRPIRLQHDANRGVGHTTDVAVTKSEDGQLQLTAAGVVSRVNDHSRDVTESGRNGFPWQASIGAQGLQWESVSKGKTVRVNGQEFTGPVLVARKSALSEISFVDLGADQATTARIAAQHTENERTDTMEWTKWLEARGLEEADLTDEAVASLRAAYEVDQAEEVADDTTDIEAEAPADDADDEAIKRAEYVASIHAAADNCKDLDETKRAKLVVDALRGQWSPEKLELTAMRQTRNSAPNVVVDDKDSKLSNNMIAAAVCQATGMDTDDKFTDEENQRAHDTFRGRIGLQELIMQCAKARGWQGNGTSSEFRSQHEDILRYAFDRNIQGAFSSVDIADILSNTANKFLMESFMAVERVWRDITAVRAVQDFKQITTYRLTGDLQYEQVGPAGEIKHGTLADTSYTNQANTYAKMLGITRQDQINDDLGALEVLPRRLGRGAGLKINDVFWTEFLADAGTFYTTARGNYFDGASSALSIDSLGTAEQYFMDQTDDDGKPLGAMPSMLVVPTALYATARQIFASTEVRNPSGTKQDPVANIYNGKYDPIVSAYLGNSSYTGYSAAAWYLLANPSDIPVIETVFLNGQEAPTVESADADFNTLGIQLRGYHDFGVNKQEYRGAVKSKGSA
jgi:phage major head subunit gpT-like protein